MMSTDELLLILPYILAMVLVFTVYIWRRQRVTNKNLSQLDLAVSAGLMEPASLHPLIDVARCIGCGSCVEACPEKKVIGLIRGKATLVNPTSCIGHGACRVACPTNSITLVFGTEKRGVDIPFVNENFETNVPGIFIAGELGGMGLIRNAVNQGVQAVEAIGKREVINSDADYDLIIVGAGPAGLAAALAAREKGLSYIVLEQDTLGGTIAHYPRGKIVMTAPAILPLAGEMTFKETTKEALMAFWQQVTLDYQLNIHFQERVEKVHATGRDTGNATGKGFIVKTPHQELQAANLLLAIGRRGTPRKLGVPGEDLTKVVYRLIDEEQYRCKNVLVVGGGDSALEAACSIAELASGQVTLCYRGDGFSRAKVKNRERVAENEKHGLLQVLLNANVTEITEAEVVIDCNGKLLNLNNDAVIVCAGGILPSAFLQSTGIEVETKFGTA